MCHLGFVSLFFLLFIMKKNLKINVQYLYLYKRKVDLQEAYDAMVINYSDLLGNFEASNISLVVIVS